MAKQIRIKRHLLRAVGQMINREHQLLVGGDLQTVNHRYAPIEHHDEWALLSLAAEGLSEAEKQQVAGWEQEFAHFINDLVYDSWPSPEHDPRPFIGWARSVVSAIPQGEPFDRWGTPIPRRSWRGSDIPQPSQPGQPPFAALDPIIVQWEAMHSQAVRVAVPAQMTEIEEMHAAARAGDDGAFLVLLDALQEQGYSRIRAVAMLLALEQMRQDLDSALRTNRMNHYLIRQEEIPRLAERIGMLAELADSWVDEWPIELDEGGRRDPRWGRGEAGLVYNGQWDVKGKLDPMIRRGQIKLTLTAWVKTATNTEYDRPSWDMRSVRGSREPDDAGVLAMWRHRLGGSKHGKTNPLFIDVKIRKDTQRSPPSIHAGVESVNSPVRQVQDLSEEELRNPDMMWRTGWHLEPLLVPPGEGWRWAGLIAVRDPVTGIALDRETYRDGAGFDKVWRRKF